LQALQAWTTSGEHTSTSMDLHLVNNTSTAMAFENFDFLITQSERLLLYWNLIDDSENM